MKTILISLCGILLVVAACKRANNNNAAATPSPGVNGSGSLVAENGLSGTDRATFYHLAEGSELYPYSWIKALHTPEDKPFLDNPERFGLLPDPSNPDGLPVGLTKASRPGVPLGEMVGVNCAGCHVGEITFNNRSYRVDGAPNLFDLVSFDLELFKDSKATVKDPKQLFAFLVRWWKQGHDAPPTQPNLPRRSMQTDADNPVPPPPTEATRELLIRHQSLDDLRNSGALEKSIADEIDAIVKRHESVPLSQANVAPTGASTRVYKSPARKAAQKAPAPNGIFAASKSVSDRETSISGILGDIEQYVALMYSYIDLLKALSNTGDGFCTLWRIRSC